MSLLDGVTAILFDYGGTLATAVRPADALAQAYRDMSSLLGTGADMVAAACADVDATLHPQRAGLRELVHADVMRDALARRGIIADPRVIDAALEREQSAWAEGIRLRPSARECLAAAQARGLRIGVVSNAPYRAASMRKQLEIVGIDRFFDAVILSSEVGWRKPAPQIFEAALGALGAPARSTLMVGDSLREDVEGARGLRMRTLLLCDHNEAVANTTVSCSELSELESLLRTSE